TMNRSRLDMNTARDRTPTIPATRRGDGDAPADGTDGDAPADGTDGDGEGAGAAAGRALDGCAPSGCAPSGCAPSGCVPSGSASVAGVESTAHPLEIVG